MVWFSLGFSVTFVLIFVCYILIVRKIRKARLQLESSLKGKSSRKSGQDDIASRLSLRSEIGSAWDRFIQTHVFVTEEHNNSIKDNHNTVTSVAVKHNSVAEEHNGGAEHNSEAEKHNSDTEDLGEAEKQNRDETMQEVVAVRNVSTDFVAVVEKNKRQKWLRRMRVERRMTLTVGIIFSSYLVCNTPATVVLLIDPTTEKYPQVGESIIRYTMFIPQFQPPNLTSRVSAPHQYR